jgi:ribose transport system substrate-binding protein
LATPARRRPLGARFHRLVPLLLLASLAACGKDGGKAASARGDTTTVARGGSGKKVAVTLPTRQSDFWRQFEAGVKEAAGKGGYEVAIESGEGDPLRQQSQVDAFVSRKVDALLVAAPDGPTATSLAQRARAAGIAVFTAVEPPAGITPASHVASDDEGGGRVAATYLRTFMRGTARVVIVGSPGVRADAEREAGFRATLAKDVKGMPIVATVNGGGTRESARAATEAFLQANPQVEALFATSEPNTLGALDAALARGRQELVMVGYDPGPESLDAIRRESPLKASVQQSPRELGMRALQVIAEHLSNEGVPPRITIGVRIVTADEKK